jgi:PPM family protein phosphatase
MKLPAGFGVGVASHTGLVRSSNEDDYLLVGGERGLVVAIADGMGGAVGGAEASRTAVRAFAAQAADPRLRVEAGERLRRGFAAASERVREVAATVPSLRGMGTTLTAVILEAGRAVLGHVGDSRLYRLRDGRLEALTEDHAVKGSAHLLLRCIGGDGPPAEPDVRTESVAAGDRLVLATDGVWNVVPSAELERAASRHKPQEAAEAMVQAALAAGGPDNATAVVVDVVAPAGTDATDGDAAGDDAPVAVDLPRAEPTASMSDWPPPVRLRSPVWPWLLLAAAVAFLLHSTLGVFAIDAGELLRGWFGSG